MFRPMKSLLFTTDQRVFLEVLEVNREKSHTSGRFFTKSHTPINEDVSYICSQCRQMEKYCQCRKEGTRNPLQIGFRRN